MHYPKKRPKLVSGSTIPQTSTSSAGGAGGGAAGGIISMGADLVGKGIDEFVPDKNMRYGISYRPVGATVGKSAAKGAAMGAAVGSVVPGIGTAIGAAVGGVGGAVVGLIKGNKEKKKAEEAVRKMDEISAKAYDRQSQAAYSALPSSSMGFSAYGKNGMMIPKAYNFGPISYLKEGGAIILGGQRHSQEGKLGKGNPGIDTETGEKLVEVEAKEMLLTMDQSDKVHNLMEQYYENPSDDVLFDLGSVARDILLTAKKQK
jgi:hypothetical protein